MEKSRDRPSLVDYSGESESDDDENGNSSDVPPTSSFDLQNLLKCDEGAEIKGYYTKYQILSPKMAKRLCVLIVNFLFDNKIPGSRSLFAEISNEISMVFIKEDAVRISVYNLSALVTFYSYTVPSCLLQRSLLFMLGSF